MRWPSDPCSLSDPSAFSNVIDVLYVLSKPRTYVWVCYFLPRFHRSPIWFWAGGFGICTIRYPLIKFMVDRCFLWLSILLVTLSGRCGWWCIGLQGSALFADCAAVVRSSGSSAAHLCIFILHTGTFWGSSFRACHDPVAPDKNNTNKIADRNLWFLCSLGANIFYRNHKMAATSFATRCRGGLRKDTGQNGHTHMEK